MNGQDRALAPSSFATSDTAANSAAAITGALKTNTWLSDMVAADPVQAAQAGLLNIRPGQANPLIAPHLPHFDPSNRSTVTAGAQHRPTFPPELSYPNPLLQSLYGAAPLGSMVRASGKHAQQPLALSIDSSIKTEKDSLLVTRATTSKESIAAVYSQPTKSHPKPYMPAEEAEIAAKRMKLSKPVDKNAAALSQLHVPHRPEYFHCGSVIQLGENKLKRIEDLQTSDFEYSASISPDLSLDSSTVVKISEDSSRGTAFLTFSIGEHKHKPVEATVEATLEHPFFVFGQGWSSVKPESTLNYYKLKCQQLQVHDRCISLTLKDHTSINNSSYGNYRSAPSAESVIDSNTESTQSK